eukprot:1152030-Pelagomonas_calceolata.AAC.7
MGRGSVLTNHGRANIRIYRDKPAHVGSDLFPYPLPKPEDPPEFSICTSTSTGSRQRGSLPPSKPPSAPPFTSPLAPFFFAPPAAVAMVFAKGWGLGGHGLVWRMAEDWGWTPTTCMHTG